MMLPRSRLGVRTLLAIVAICGAGVWLAKGRLYPNRVPGQRFALIGPIDIDRDGRDDRSALKWMILRNGGWVDWDMPVSGPVSGGINVLTDWYVIDDYQRPGSRLPAPFGQMMVKAIKEARAKGISPMPLPRLLARLSGK
jgi:hypothetical protein